MTNRFPVNHPRSLDAIKRREDKNPEITEHMSRFIYRRRAELGLTLDDVAKKAKASKTHVWDLEQGRAKNPTLWMILSLCDALSCSINDLIGKDVSQPMYTAEEMALIAAHREIFADYSEY